MTATKRRYFIAINHYRGDSFEGFANTWETFEVASLSYQHKLLKTGLPVRDRFLMGPNGECRPCFSTNGIRKATASEIRTAKRDGCRLFEGIL